MYSPLSFIFFLEKTLWKQQKMCVKKRPKKGGISRVKAISLGCSSKNEKINLQVEIAYALL